MGKYVQANVLEVIQYYPDIQVLEMNIEEDHRNIGTTACFTTSRTISPSRGQESRQTPFRHRPQWQMGGIVITSPLKK